MRELKGERGTQIVCMQKQVSPGHMQTSLEIRKGHRPGTVSLWAMPFNFFRRESWH